MTHIAFVRPSVKTFIAALHICGVRFFSGRYRVSLSILTNKPVRLATTIFSQSLVIVRVGFDGRAQFRSRLKLGACASTDMLTHIPVSKAWLALLLCTNVAKCLTIDQQNTNASTSVPCLEPFVSWPHQSFLTSLSAALSNPDKQFLTLSVRLVDLDGASFGPGACPNDVDLAAHSSGMPLFWLVNRGKFGDALMELPTAHLQLYTLGSPYAQYTWHGQLNVSVRHACWRNLSAAARTDRMANVVGPLLLNR